MRQILLAAPLMFCVYASVSFAQNTVDASTASASEGTFIRPEEDFDRGMDRDEQVKALYRSLPAVVIGAMAELHKACLGDGAVNSTIDKRHVAVMDIDDDGDNDYILNDAHFFCVYRDSTLKSVGDQGSANIAIFSTTTKGVIQSAALYTTSAEIFQFKGSAVYSGFGTGKTPSTRRFVQIKRGTSKEIASLPEGGKVIYSAGKSEQRPNLFKQLFGDGEKQDQSLEYEDTPDDPMFLEAMRKEKEDAVQEGLTPFQAPIPTPRPDISPKAVEQQTGISDADQTSDAMPASVRVKFAEQYLACKKMGGETLSDVGNFVISVDFDGDGVRDYIADQTALTCDFESGEKRVMGGNPEDGKTVWFYKGKNDDAEFVTEQYIFKGSVRRHASFASIETVDFAGRTEITQIQDGRATIIPAVPPGGVIIMKVGG